MAAIMTDQWQAYKKSLGLYCQSGRERPTIADNKIKILVNKNHLLLLVTMCGLVTWLDSPHLHENWSSGNGILHNLPATQRFLPHLVVFYSTPGGWETCNIIRGYQDDVRDSRRAAASRNGVKFQKDLGHVIPSSFFSFLHPPASPCITISLWRWLWDVWWPYNCNFHSQNQPERCEICQNWQLISDLLFLSFKRQSDGLTGEDGCGGSSKEANWINVHATSCLYRRLLSGRRRTSKGRGEWHTTFVRGGTIIVNIVTDAVTFVGETSNKQINNCKFLFWLLVLLGFHIYRSPRHMNVHGILGILGSSTTMVSLDYWRIQYWRRQQQSWQRQLRFPQIYNHDICHCCWFTEPIVRLSFEVLRAS